MPGEIDGKRHNPTALSEKARARQPISDLRPTDDVILLLFRLRVQPLADMLRHNLQPLV
jgi:hypothetical protein